MQGDACHLPTDLGQFGCILAANLIDRLHRPSDFLDSLADLVAPDGIVVITSPYTWLEQFTEKVFFTFTNLVKICPGVPDKADLFRDNSSLIIDPTVS